MTTGATATTSEEPRRTRHGHFGTLGAGALVAVLLLAPVLHGCIQPFWRSILAAVLSLLGGAGLCVMLWRGTSLRLTPGTMPLALFTLLVLFQTLPIGSELGPRAAAVVGLEVTESPSLVPAITMSRARDCLGLLVVFIGASLLLSSTAWIRRVAWALPILASLLAVYYVTTPFLEFVPAHGPAGSPDRDHVFGTYLNRNHLGAFFVLALIVGAGLFVNRRQTLNHDFPGFARRQGYIVVLLITTCAGLLLTASRGAFASLVLGMLALGYLLARRREATKRWGPLLGMALVLTLVIVAMPLELTARFGAIGRSLTESGARPDLWMAALRVFEAFPFVGCGLGNFGQLSVLTQADTITGHLEHAHGDLFQVMAETGVIGLNLLLSSALLLGLHVLRRSRRSRGDRRTILVCAALAALFAFSLHALVDFNFQIPALAIWAAALGGIASGAMARANGLPALGWKPNRWIMLPASAALWTSATFATIEAWSLHQRRLADQTTDTDQRFARLLAADQTWPGAGQHALAAAELLFQSAARRTRGTEIEQLAERALGGNPLSARAHWLRGVTGLWRDNPKALSHLHRTAALTPPGRRLETRIDAGLAIAKASKMVAARGWFHALFTDRGIDAKEALVKLYRRAPADLDLTPLIPDRAEDLLATYAALLLHDGELTHRQRVLDAKLSRRRFANRSTAQEAITLKRGRK